MEQGFNEEFIKLIKLFCDKPTLLNDVRESISLVLTTFPLKQRFYEITNSFFNLVNDQAPALLFFLDIPEMNSEYIENISQEDMHIAEDLLRIKRMYGSFLNDARNASADPYNFKHIELYTRSDFTFVNIYRKDGESLRLQLDFEDLTCFLRRYTEVYLNIISDEDVKNIKPNVYVTGMLENFNSITKLLNSTFGRDRA